MSILHKKGDYMHKKVIICIKCDYLHKKVIIVHKKGDNMHKKGGLLPPPPLANPNCIIRIRGGGGFRVGARALAGGRNGIQNAQLWLPRGPLAARRGVRFTTARILAGVHPEPWTLPVPPLHPAQVLGRGPELCAAGKHNPTLLPTALGDSLGDDLIHR